MRELKPNYSLVGRNFDCDRRTAKKYYERALDNDSNEVTKEVTKRPSILDPYKDKIQEKLNIGCSAHAIFYFIKKQGYPGGETIVKDYCRIFRVTNQQKVTIRVETNPGLSAQVDWKESMTLYNRQNEPVTFNLFLYVLGYSRYKYIVLTRDRKQETLFNCLNDAFEATGGVPDEIWFDNMKQVVDHQRSTFGNPVFNEKFREFSRDAGYKPIACRPFRPQTKGKVESLARTTERLRVMNNEFDDFWDLYKIISEFNDDLNYETSQAIHEIPADRWVKEKEYLRSNNYTLLDSYSTPTLTRKVSNESMVNYENRKYSVPVKLIGKEVKIKSYTDELRIYYNGECVRTHNLSSQLLNYEATDRVDILRTGLMHDRTDDEITNFIHQNLQAFDELGDN
ncbi:IS21 family transposase [Pediococcus ethanolidurans]|uniref:IS21 family transposase n=1 Tax=Pediococcus ethanolidurans TaxID=319653 RepID=UPI0027D97148|nr:IS21 family transposase [Pediococcus ethanolidurans]